MNTSALDVFMLGLHFGSHILAGFAALAVLVGGPTVLIMNGSKIWAAATIWCRFRQRNQALHEHAVAACLFASGNLTRQCLHNDRATGTKAEIDRALFSLCARGLVERKTVGPHTDTPYFELTPEGETIIGSEMSP